MTNDEEHLRLLSIFHFILGGLYAIFACIPLLHLALGIGMVTGGISEPRGSPFPLRFMGGFFIVFSLLFIILGWSYSISMIMAGRRLRQRRAYTYCMVMAALTCAQVPLGTCLGVFTIVVLARPSVKLMFESKKKAAVAGSLADLPEWL
jgi:hypothetical protein